MEMINHHILLILHTHLPSEHLRASQNKAGIQ